MESPSADALTELLDKQAIAEVVLRYCRGVDRMDRELVRSCYHPDARDVHGSFQGDRDAYLDWVFDLLSRYDSTMHFVGNQLVEPRGDVARCESYGIAFHRGDLARPDKNLVTGFRFVDRFERRDDRVWRIAQRVATTEWARVDTPQDRWPVPDSFLTGRRDRDDPVYEPLP